MIWYVLGGVGGVAISLGVGIFLGKMFRYADMADERSRLPENVFSLPAPSRR